MRLRSQLLQWCLEVVRSLVIAGVFLFSLNAASDGAGNEAELCADAAAKPTREVLFDRLTMLENHLFRLEERYALLPQKLVEEHQLERIQAQLVKHRAELGGLLEEVFLDEMPPSLRKSIRDLAYDIEHDWESITLWNSRVERLTFSGIVSNPRSLMYDRLYEVKAERGDQLKVRFSRTLAEHFYWEGKDSARKEAAHASLVGIGRGIRPSSSKAASGIDFLGEVDGYHIVKIQIVGHGVGGYRVYGCLINGVFEFVLWEHEGTHDHRYVRRVTQKTADICKRL